MALLLGALGLISNAALCESGCTKATSAVATSTWPSITPPKEDVEVVYSSPSGWVGLNRIYAGRQVLTHKRRGLIPWLMPQIDTIFPFSHALQAPANETPLFYVDHLITAADVSDSVVREIHLLRLVPLGNERELATTSGASIFTFAPLFPSRSVIPTKISVLSNTVLTIQPERKLSDGEYLIVLGPVASNGFEFQINCTQPENPATPRINAESAH